MFLKEDYEVPENSFSILAGVEHCYIIKNVLSKSECEKFINFGLDQKFLTKKNQDRTQPLESWFKLFKSYVAF
jgi:hypothetical protein